MIGSKKRFCRIHNGHPAIGGRCTQFSHTITIRNPALPFYQTLSPKHPCQFSGIPRSPLKSDNQFLTHESYSRLSCYEPKSHEMPGSSKP